MVHKSLPLDDEQNVFEDLAFESDESGSLGERSRWEMMLAMKQALQ